jgi:hypothetical protein
MLEAFLSLQHAPNRPKQPAFDIFTPKPLLVEGGANTPMELICVSSSALFALNK